MARALGDQMARQQLTHEKGGHELWLWPHYSGVQRDEWYWPNFSAFEMRCQKTGRLQISPVFMDALQHVRRVVGIPMIVTSGWRSPEHNQAVSHTKSREGPHPDSQAVDVAVSRSDAFNVMRAAISTGFKGIGLKQHGDGRYLHIDMWHRRETGIVWTYSEP